ncbi:hypothetical protein LCGC14_2131880, partial [marine sediment metagenome]
ARQKLLAITSQYGEFDIDELNSWVNNLDADIAETLRFVDDKIELDIEEIETEGDDEFEDEIGPITQVGDLWELGRHRLLCGDNTADKDKLINHEIHLLFTDPPYGINIVSGSGHVDGGGKLGFVGGDGIAKARKYKKVINDDRDFDPRYLLDWSDKIILFGANHYAHQLPKSSHWLVWMKKPDGAERKNTFSDAELMWTNVDGKTVDVYRYLWFGLVREGKRDMELAERVHPTQKPVGLLSSIILDYTVSNEYVADPFLGSGSTLLACEITNRICYGMELDPHYCDVVVNRYMDWCIKNEREYIIKLNGEVWQ